MKNGWIDQIEVKGFKSIAQARIKLKHINILIGGNGSGKTNFISLFSMLRAMGDRKLQGYIGKNGGAGRFLYLGSKHTERIQFNINFCVADEREDYEYHCSLIPTVDDQMILEREEYRLKNRKELLIATEGNREASWQNKYVAVDGYRVPSLADQKWRSYHFHDTSDTAMIKQVQNLNDNVELAADGRNLAAFLYRLKKTEGACYERIVQIIQYAAPYFEEFFLRPDPLNEQQIRLEWKNKESDIPFIAAQLSDGTLRFICLVTLLMQPCSMQPDIILLDEPELGLHPYAIALLAGLIKKIGVDRQIIVATQSAELLNEFEPQDVIVVDGKNNQSTFQRLEKDRLKDWLEDYTLGELWQRNIIGGRPS